MPTVTNVVFDKLLTKLFALGSIRGVVSSKVLVVRRSVNDKEYQFALSKREPAAAILPFNILWMPFDPQDTFYKKLLRRVAKEPEIGSSLKNTWKEVKSLDDILTEDEYFDIFDSTLRGDYSAQTPVTIYTASETVAGKMFLSVDNSSFYYPVAAGNNDTRLYNSRPPLSHVHSEFDNIPGNIISAFEGLVHLSTLNPPSVGDILVLINDYEAIWRKPVASDIVGYVSPVKSLEISCPASVLERTSVDVESSVVRFDGTTSDVTVITSFTVTGHSAVTIEGNTITVGEVEEATTVVISATYHDIVLNKTLVKQKDLVISNIPAVSSLEIESPSSMDELTSINLEAVAHFADGSSSNVTQVSWSVDKPSIASLTGSVLSAYDVSAGATRSVPIVVTAQYTDSSSVPITVTASKTIQIVDKNTLIPASVVIIGPSEVIEGTSVVYVPRVFYNNGLSDDLVLDSTIDASVIWMTPHQDLVFFSASQEKSVTVTFSHVLHTIQNAEINVQVTLGEHVLHATKGITVSENNVIQSFTLVGPSTIDENTYGQYDAVIEYDDGLTEIVSIDCVWSISLSNGVSNGNILAVRFDNSTHRLYVDDIFGNIENIRVKAEYTANDVTHQAEMSVLAVDDVRLYPESLEIVGPETLTELTSSSFSAVIVLQNGTRHTRQVTWQSLNTDLADFTGDLLTVYDISEDSTVDIRATYIEEYSENTITVSQTKTINLIYNPPVIIGIDLDTSSGSSTLNEKGEYSLVIHQRWSDGAITTVDNPQDIDGTVQFVLTPSISDILVNETADSWVLTTGNVIQNQNIRIVASWEDSDTSVEHSDVFDVVISATTPEIVSMSFDKDSPLDLTEFTTTSLTLSGVNEESTTVDLIKASNVIFEVTESRQGILLLNNSGDSLVITATNIDTAELPVLCTIQATYQQATTNITVNVKEEQLQYLRLDTENSVNSVTELSSVVMVLTAVFDSGNTYDVSKNSDVVWTTSNDQVATISDGILNTFNVTADSVVDVQAEYKGFTASVFDITVLFDAPDVTDLVMTLSSLTVTEDDEVTIESVIATFDDASSLEVKNDVAYTVTPETKGSVTGNILRFNDANIVEDTSITLQASYRGFTVDQSIQVTYVKKVVSVVCNVTNLSLFEEDSLEFDLIVTYDDQTTEDVTLSSDTTWSVSNSSVLTLSGNTCTALLVTEDTSCTLIGTWKTHTVNTEILVKDIVISFIEFVTSPETLVAGNTSPLVMIAHRNNNTSFVVPVTDIVFSSEHPEVADVEVANNTATLVANNVTEDIDVLISGDYLPEVAINDTISVHIQAIRPVSLDIQCLSTLDEESLGEIEIQVIASFNNDTELTLKPSDGLVVTSGDDNILGISVSTDSYKMTAKQITATTTVTLSASYQGIVETKDIQIINIPKVVSVSITSPLTAPQNMIDEGSSIQLSAVAVYDNGESVSVTSSSDTTWVSNKTNAATVTSSGLVRTYNVTDPPVVVNLTCVYKGVTGVYSLRVINNS